VVWTLDDHKQAQSYCEESLQIARRLGDKRSMALTLDFMGLMATSDGRLSEAREYEEQSVALSREIGDDMGVSNALCGLGVVDGMQGNYSAGHGTLLESLPARLARGSKHSIAHCLLELAVVAWEHSEPVRLVTLLAAADELFKASGSPPTPFEREQRGKGMAIARGKLKSEAFVAAWERGERLSIDEAVALAYESPVAGQAERVAQPVPQKAGPVAVDTLTAREMDVLRLVATGLTNPEIAAHLCVTINTVQTHLRSIFSKINVNTRSAAVRFAFEHSMN
jgi:non-specific serine/threonine protein kinase